MKCLAVAVCGCILVLAAPAVETAVARAFAHGGAAALVISSPDGGILVAENTDTPLVPASVLKLLTALVALDALGPDYRFPTDFALTGSGRLRITGYGDPLFISEVMTAAAGGLVKRLPHQPGPCLTGIELDDRYFAAPLVVPGVSDSDNPYDAPNGALCANFNTVFFSRDPDTGRLESAEPQTPLLPFARERILQNAAATDRVVLSHRQHDVTRYTGLLFRNFLETRGCPVSGPVDLVAADEPSVAPLWRFTSPYPLTAIIEKMMAYSNNFIANQLLIAAAARVAGPPGTLTAAAALAERHARDTLGLTSLKMVEGSGISRENRVSAADMHRVLRAFHPYRHLLRRSGADVFKTGTLKDVRTRVGYLTVSGRDFGYVVMLNGNRLDMDAAMRDVARRIREINGAP